MLEPHAIHASVRVIGGLQIVKYGGATGFRQERWIVYVPPTRPRLVVPILYSRQSFKPFLSDRDAGAGE